MKPFLYKSIPCVHTRRQGPLISDGCWTKADGSSSLNLNRYLLIWFESIELKVRVVCDGDIIT